MKRTILFISLLIMNITVTLHAQAIYQDETKPLDERVQDALSRMTVEEKCRLSYAQSKFTSPGVQRLGIPELYMSDGPHGVRPEINWNDWEWAGWTNDACTAFPALTCLAATWNPELAQKYGKNVGEEARYRNKNILLGPGVNIYRTPLNGRNFEYMGEDPLLAGKMAAQWIIGLQKNGVSCCLKHFVLNDQEEFRGNVDVKVSDRAFYELYLRPFQIAINEGNPWSIMGSYNQYKNVHNCHNDFLLNGILRKEMGFKGAVISDWGGTHDTMEAALGGLDIEMGSYTNGLTTEAGDYSYDDYYLGTAYLNKVKNGEIPMSVVNEKAGRVLKLIFQTSMNSHKPFGALNSEAHIAACREIAAEGIVLLKNGPLPISTRGGEALLPIDASKYKNVLVVGDNATKSLTRGGGSSELKAKDEVSPLRGIKERFGKDWSIVYAQGYESGKPHYGHADKIRQSLQDSLRNDALEKARHADLIIYIGGLNKNHFEDCEGGDRLSYNMSYDQDRLISELLDIQPRMITVITSGNAVAMPWLTKAPAVIQNWYCGSETGHALADVLSGDVNPSGKTIFTYAEKLEDYPAHKYGKISYPGISPKDVPAAFDYGETDEPHSADLLKNFQKNQKLIPASLTNAHRNASTDSKTHAAVGDEVQLYAEDILVGYRYFDTMKQKVVFPFGYGLSYTTFSYGKATEATVEGGWDITVPITNTGKVAGKEVVELYVAAPKSPVLRPSKELKAFQKVALNPGETKNVTLHVTTDDLRYFDETAHEWRLAPGTYTFMIGASSADIRQSIKIKE